MYPQALILLLALIPVVIVLGIASGFKKYTPEEQERAREEIERRRRAAWIHSGRR